MAHKTGKTNEFNIARFKFGYDLLFVLGAHPPTAFNNQRLKTAFGSALQSGGILTVTNDDGNLRAGDCARSHCIGEGHHV